jgi:hypothetical protein
MIESFFVKECIFNNKRRFEDCEGNKEYNKGDEESK